MRPWVSRTHTKWGRVACACHSRPHTVRGGREENPNICGPSSLADTAEASRRPCLNQGCPLTSTYALWHMFTLTHMNAHIHTHINTYIYQKQLSRTWQRGVNVITNSHKHHWSIGVLPFWRCVTPFQTPSSAQKKAVLHTWGEPGGASSSQCEPAPEPAQSAWIQQFLLLPKHGTRNQRSWSC